MNDDLTLNRLDDAGKLVLRLVLGILVLFHGVTKILHGIAPIQEMLLAYGFPGVLANAVYLGEVVGPALLILGYYARIGAGLIVINMLVAVLLAHTGDLLTVTEHGGWRLELQGMYLFAALALVFMGPGRFGLDRR
jgi:putative oxidoreductase